MAEISKITLPDGVTYDLKDTTARSQSGGGGGLLYGVCSTAAAAQAKVVSVDSSFTLQEGATVLIKFTNAQTYNGQPTLNVNSTGAKNVVRNGTTAGFRYQWYAGESLLFVYDGTSWMEVNGGVATTTYYGVTKLYDNLTSTSTTLAATANAVKKVNDRITYGNTDLTAGSSALAEGVYYAYYE